MKSSQLSRVGVLEKSEWLALLLGERKLKDTVGLGNLDQVDYMTVDLRLVESSKGEGDVQLGHWLSQQSHTLVRMRLSVHFRHLISRTSSIDESVDLSVAECLNDLVASRMVTAERLSIVNIVSEHHIA
jgi:hypothetical protein